MTTEENMHNVFVTQTLAINLIIDNWWETPNMQKYGLYHWQMNLDDLCKELEAESQEQTPFSLSKKIKSQLIEEKT